MIVCVLALIGRVAAADPKDPPPAEDKRYDNKDLEKLRQAKEKKAPASAPVPPSAAPSGAAYSNSDLSKLPEPTKLPEAPPGSAAPAEPVQTYTNQNLGAQPAAEAPPAEPPTEAAPDAVTLATDVDHAQANVDELEARLRAVRNPFLPRPVLPPEEEEAWRGLNNTERSTRVETQLKDARDALAKAIERLSALQGQAPPAP